MLPVQTWRYKGEDSTMLHMGPYAEDFRAAFGLGTDSLTIGHIDLGGVLLAAGKRWKSEPAHCERPSTRVMRTWFGCRSN